MARRIFVHRRGAPRGVLCLSFSNEARSVFSFVKKRVFSTVPSPRVAHAPPGGPQITPVCTIFLVFRKGSCVFSEKPSPLSSKMPIGGPAGAHPSKKGRQSRAKWRLEKKPPPLSHGMATCASRGPKIEQKYSVLPFKKNALSPLSYGMAI